MENGRTVVTVWHACDPTRHKQECVGSTATVSSAKPTGKEPLVYELHLPAELLDDTPKGSVHWDEAMRWPYQVTCH